MHPDPDTILFIWRQRANEAHRAHLHHEAAVTGGSRSPARRRADAAPGQSREQVSAARHALVTRRFAASILDYLLAGTWAGLVFLALVALPVAATVTTVTTGHLLSAGALTVPVTAVIGLLEAHGSSPGKRLVGLRIVGPSGRRLSRPRALARTALKVSLPWELAHAALWQLHGGRSDAYVELLLLGALALPALAALAILRAKRPWHDRLAGTRLCVEPAPPRSGSTRPEHAHRALGVQPCS